MKTYFEIPYYDTVKNNIHHVTTTVTNVYHRLSYSGLLEMDLYTDHDIYMREVESLYGGKENFVEQVYLMEDLAIGDICLVHQEEVSPGKYRWVWELVEKTNNKENKRCKLDIVHMTHCPVCGEKLIPMEGGLYCINLNCNSKIREHLRRLIVLYNFDNLFMSIDLVIINKLINISRVKSIGDLLTVTPEEVTSLESWFYKEEEDGEGFVRRLHWMVNTITLADYLFTLGLDRVSRVSDPILTTMTAPEFIKRLENDDEELKNALLKTYTKKSYELMKKYFLLDSVKKDMEVLDSLGVFHTDKIQKTLSNILYYRY